MTLGINGDAPMRRIGIIGAGIGGLTLAIALARHGIAAQVFERAAALNEVGAGLSLPSNAMEVFARLGLDDAIVARSSTIDAGELCTHGGATLRRIGYSSQTIHRARLQELLAGTFGRDNIRFGKELVGFDETAVEVVARFSDGSEAPLDILVGADGLHSAVRAHLFPEVALRDSGQTAFRGIGSLALKGDMATTGREIWGVKRRFGFAQVGADSVYWFAVLNQPCDLATERAQPRLLKMYSEFPEPVAEIIAATPADTLVKTDIWDFAPISTWHRGRVVLMGDAAHATTPNLGQGAAQAIESAFVLACCIAEQEDHGQAFSAFQALRLEKAHDVTNWSWQFGKLAQLENVLLRFLRDLAIRTVPDALHGRQLERIFSFGP